MFNRKKISASHLLFLGIVFSAITIQSTSAQNTITINPNVQRFIGNTTNLDRSKYLQGHFWFIQNKEDPDFVKFKKEYNISDNYYGSRIFWNPIGTIKNGNIPTNIPKRYSGERDVVNYVATGAAKNLFHDKTVDYSEVNLLPKTKEMATYTAESFKNSWEFVPKFFEPFNEPMVHAGDYYPGRNDNAKSASIITKICEFYREVGKAIHKVPELNKITVMGYASAFPEFEARNFNLWNSRYKKFIDIAGKDMDAFSVHLYDGVGVNNNGGRRSGSNSEAILDLIEAYSFEKLNTVKPYAITEYGRLVASQPGWTQGGTVSNYEPVENSQAVRSQVHLAMSFMERGSKMLSAIPFSVGKGEPTKKFSRASLWTKVGDDKWELTPRKYFFEIWKDVKGKRVLINSENIDIQTQAFVDADKMYVVLNNLNDAIQTLKLNTVNLPDIESVDIKSVKIFSDKVPEFTKETVSTVPSEVKIRYGETLVLTYNFKANVAFNNKVTSKKYYANKTIKPIAANTNVSFKVENVKIGAGTAKLRLSLGRDHGKSLKPTVLINNKLVPVTGDVIRGYDQANRRQFFGTLEIPFDIALLKTGTNDIKVKFPDNGGNVSSAILQLEVFEKPVVANNDNIFYIINKQTGKKVRPINAADDAALVQASANAMGNWVRWKKVTSLNQYFYLQNVETGKYFRPVSDLDNSLFGLKPTTNIGNFTQWKEVASSEGYFYLENRGTGKYIRPSSEDDISADTGNNFNLIQKPTSSIENWTQWKFEAINDTNDENLANNTLSVHEIGQVNNSNNSINIFPNPANSVLNISAAHSGNTEKPLNITFKNILGVDVKTIKTDTYDTAIDVSELTGMYFVNIKSEYSNVVKKLIVN